MIDLHCHILPGIDDGAFDLEDSVAMAAQGADDGIGVICATPHIRHDHDVRIVELDQRTDQLNAELRAREVEAEVAPGGEVAETILEHLDDDELRRVSMGRGGRWILLEPGPGPLSDSLMAAVEHLAGRGFRSLIAHPERHLGDDPAGRLAALIERGALVQATAAHMIAADTAPPMLGLAGRGLIHMLGSDAHSSRHGRPLQLSEGLAALAQVETTAPHIEWMSRDAPGAILSGEDVESPFGLAG